MGITNPHQLGSATSSLTSSCISVHGRRRRAPTEHHGGIAVKGVINWEPIPSRRLPMHHDDVDITVHPKQLPPVVRTECQSS